jgi:hypothetical protein
LLGPVSAGRAEFFLFWKQRDRAVWELMSGFEQGSGIAGGERARLVDRAAKAWIGELVDLGGRNTTS